MDDWENQDFILGYDQLSQATLEFISEFNLLAAVGSMPVIILLQTLSRYFQGRELMLLNALMVGSGEGITSADQGYRLLELSEIAVKDPDACKYFGSKLFDPPAWEKLPETSQFKRSFHGYIKEYGHRAVYELDIINPRWNEDPTYLLDYIKNGMNNANLHKLQLVQKEKQEKAWLEIKEKIPVSEHSSIIELVKECQAGAAVREKTKSVLAELMEAYRVIAKKIGLRFCQGGIIEDSQDVFFCTWSELFSVLSNEWDGSGLKILIDERKVWLKEMEELAPPDMILGDTPRFKILAVSDSARSIHGVPVAAGKAAGSVRLVNHPDQGSKLQKGEVMVVPSTDPAWTPLFLRAGALVMETGGFLSHGSIVAREYGIPAVANIPGIMSILKDGQTILVDGDNGKIFLNEDLTNNK